MSKEVVAEVIALIELGMIAPEDIVKCLRKANSEPAQRTWRGLTDKEFEEIIMSAPNATVPVFLWQLIQDRLKEKNT